MSVADELEKLNNLRQQGIISDDEFQAQKVRLLQQSAPVATSPIAAKPTLPVGVGFVDKAAEHQAVGAEVKRLNMLSFALGIPGMGLQVYGNATGQMAITLLGTALLIGGLVMYAKMRGRHSALLALGGA